jgi:glycosyltransferase involved in cell wall biosynthesis
LGLIRNGVLVPHFVWQVVRLARLVARLKVDVVHTNTLKSDIIGSLAAVLVGRKLVWSVHDRISADYMPAFAVRLLRTFVRFLPDHVITNSNSTLHTFLPKLPKFYSVVYPGIEKPPENLMRARDGGSGAVLGSGNKTWSIGIIGRISPTKGHHIFVEAAEIVSRFYPNTLFKVIGAAFFSDSPYEEGVRADVVRRRLRNMEFTGFRKDVYAEIEKLDIVVHASTTPEPFGQVIVEAMACRRPVIATNAGGVREIVVNGMTGWLVPMGDAGSLAERIIWYIENPECTRTMVERAYERATTRFTLGSTAQSFEGIYRDVILPRACRSPSFPDPDFPIGSL